MIILFKVEAFSPEETRALGEKMAAFLKPGDVICLFGDLGAGKTCFAQGVGRGLGVLEHITSPTFILAAEYQGKIPFYHLDMYRLSGVEDMEGFSYEDYFYGERVTLIEWADRIIELLPAERLDVYLKCVPGQEESREIRFVPLGNRYQQLVRDFA